MKEGKPYTGHSDPQTKFGTIVGKRPSHTATSTINTGERYPTDVLEFPSESDTIHPTQKPVALFEYLIRTYTQEGDTVLDMTCGSGTTAVACVRSNRHFICGDLSEEYVNLARNRLASTDPYQDKPVKGGGKQLSLFGGDNG
jgi:site-specific DNA-methyltransferase (adenine-specific)